MSLLQSIGSRQRQTAIAYLVALVAVIVAGWLGIIPGAGEAYPGQPLTTHPYRVAMAGIVVVLAAWLGLGVARIPPAIGGPVMGLGLLLLGGIATGGALAFAPYVLYPGDQYPVTFMWLLLGAPVGFVAWAIATFLGSRTAAVA